MKAVLFDFGGTLDSNGVAWKERFYPVYKESGINVSLEKFTRAFYDADDNLPVKHDLKGLDLEKTIELQVRDLLDNLKIPRGGQDGGGEAGRIKNRFLSESRDFFASAKKVLSELRRRYRLGVVSNFYGNLDSVLQGEGLASYFDVVVDSGRTGFQKPDSRIFNAALGALQTEPCEAFMVGDSLERDMKGAEGVGMKHAWIYGERFKGKTPAPCCQKGFLLKNLPDLPALLAGIR